ncbi:MAG TPA: TetR/AcrR family transcriptional regulator [Pseudolysinimonas sp.]|nr:TetR/AcrR family transcriptional regulator [Pseudolysinimonas sp.]
MTAIDIPETGDGLRERKKQQTRRAIHEAAYRLVDEHGLEGTTIDQICHEADVSSRTFFNYFPSKTAAALGLPAEPVDEESAERFRSATGSLVDALCDLIGGDGQFALRQTRLKALVTRHPEMIPTLSSMMTAARGRFVAIAAERASSTAEAELAVTMVLAALSLSVHDEREVDLPTARRLKAACDRIARVRTAPLSTPVASGS